MNSNQRLAEAKRLSSMPIKENQLGQKFYRGARIKVIDKMPIGMSHFESGFEGIVEYTYAQKYWGNDIDSYSVIQLSESGEPINSIAWYLENQLTLVNNDLKIGELIIKEYYEKIKLCNYIISKLKGIVND